MKKAIMGLLLCLFILLPLRAPADGDAGVYTVYDEGGSVLFTFAGAMEKGDEYISADNRRYTIDAVDDAAMSARAISQGNQELPDVNWLETSAAIVVSSTSGDKSNGDNADSGKLIALYATHSDESYKPTDGTESASNGYGGIYDVCEALKAALEEKGIQVVLDDTIHAPHDSGAYRRSRQTAVDLLKKGPDALIDIHRDGIPDAGEYKVSIDGEDVSKVRLLVGRSNQNSGANKEFALELKAVADKRYPGLIKDIFIGKGSYNQDLMSNAILLEMGTHTLDKERVLGSAEMVSNVLADTLYGGVSGSAKDGNQSGANAGAGNGVLWLIITIVVAVGAFALLQTGSGRAALEKVKRGASELTAGVIGKKKE